MSDEYEYPNDNPADDPRALDVLAEFVADVDAVGVEAAAMDWPDLVVTYRKAKALIERKAELASGPKEASDRFWADAEKGPHGQNWKRLVIPTYDENGGEEKEFDWDRPAQLTLQEEEGLRVIMGDPCNESSPDVVFEKTPTLWRLFVHHDGGDPLCYIEFTKARAFIYVDQPGETKTLLVEERTVTP